MRLEDAVVLALVVGLVVHGHGDRAAAAAHHAPAVASVGHLAQTGSRCQATWAATADDTVCSMLLLTSNVSLLNPYGHLQNPLGQLQHHRRPAGEEP